MLISIAVLHSNSSGQCNITVTPGSTTIVSPATIYDPGGTSNYGNSLNVTTTYTAPAGYRLTLNFTSFNTESGYDFMWLYDAANASGTEKIKVSGTALPSPASHTSTGQSFTIKFTSDASVVASGFVATLTCLATCSNTTGGGEVTGDQNQCASYDPTLINSSSAATGGSGGTTYQWESSLNNSTWTDISGATALTYDPVTITQTTYYRRKSKSSSCSVWGATSTTITKTVSAAPTANAGIDINNCELANFNLTGNTPGASQTGAWSVISGTAYTSNATNQPNINYTVAAGTSATLRWTITSGTCSASDDVVITNSNTSCNTSCTNPLNINGDLENEGMATSFPLTFQGTPATLIDGNNNPLGWAQRYGTNPTNTTTFQGAFYLKKTGVAGNPRSGTHMIYLKGSGFCLSPLVTTGKIACGKTYELTIWAAAYSNTTTQTIAPFALESYFGGGSSAAQNTLAEFIAPASSSWNNLNWQRYSVTITIPNNGYNYGDFYFTANDNTTGIVIDDVCIREVDGGSFANAGADIFNCSNNFTLSANTPLSGYTGSWSIVSGSATISNASSPTSSASISSGTSAILRWSVTDGSCTTTDDVTIGYSNTQGVTVNSPTLCAGSSGTLTASDCTGSLLWSTGATTSSITVNPASTTIYTVTCTPSSTNQVLNPGFESATNFQNWSNWANAAVTTSAANIRTGTKAAEINAATAWGGFAQDIAVTPGQKINITWWAKTNNINVGSELGYKFLNSSYTELTTFEVRRIMSLTYAQYTATAVVPPNAAYVQIYAGASSPSLVHVDDISITSTSICNSFATSSVTVKNCEICDNNIDDDGDGIIDCADDDCGYITNKDFDNGTANWNLYLQSGNVATFTVDNTSQLVGVSAAKVNVSTTASGTEWHVQLAQTGKSIIAGKTYKISFSAKASSARTISAAAQLGTSPYTSYGYQNFNVTTTAATYSFTFTASTSISNNITLLFNLATAVGNIWIDNVVFRENCLYEICNNGIDDDGDGLIDALDTQCNTCAFVGQNLIANGEFDAGNTGFTSDYIYTPIGSMCGNFGIYSVSNRIAKVGAPNGCNLSIWAVADRANAGGNFMLIDPSAATGINDRIWAQSVTVCPNTDYVFSVWTKNMYYSEAGGYSGVDPNFRFAINGNPLPNANFIMPRQARADSLQWIKVQGYWNSGSSTTANLTISNMIPGNYGNDLAIDGLYFGLCGKTVDITAAATNFCDGSSTTLSATSQTTSSGWLFYEWLKDGVVVASGANAITYNATAAGTYKLRTYYTTANNTGCPQESNSIVLTTINKPTVSITGATSICVGATTTLSPTSGGTWTSSNTAVATVTNAGVVTAVAAGSATFTFTQTSNGCISNPTGSVTINAIPTANITGSSTICIGATTTLSPTTGGTWTSSNTAVATVTNAGVVTAVSAGTATFRFTNSSTGCQSSPSATVTVNAKPTVSISGSATICVGATTTLSPTTGGTWTSNNTSIATVTNAGVVTGVSAGSTTFTFTQTSTGCISNPTASVTVNARPTTNITGANTSLCIGNTTTISPTTSGTWTSSNTGIATITNAGVITAVSSGSATFTYTLTSTGCTSTATSPFTVNVKPSVNITGTSTICAGSTTTLSPTTGGTWISNNTSVATVTNVGVVTGVAAGTATFTFTQTSTGCPSDATASVTVNARPIPVIVGSTTLCIGSSTTLTPNTGGTWTSSNTAVATISNTGVVTAIGAGTANFTFTNTATGCTSNASSNITVSPTLSASINFNGSVCLTNSSVLTAVPTGGTSPFTYNWTGPSSYSATTQNANITLNGNYALTITDSYGCQATTTGFVYAKYDPLIVNLGTTICEGESVILNLNATNAVSYQWSSNASNATTASVTVVPVFPSSTYTVTVTNNQGCVGTNTATINVTARPTVSITGSATICQGLTTQLSPTTGGTWASDNNTIATVNNAGLVTGINAGSTTFTFTQTSTGCVSNPTSAVTVLAKPIVAFAGPTSICKLSTTQLTPNSGGTWTSSNTAVATVTNTGLVTGVGEGTASFTFTASNGCSSNASGTLTVDDKVGTTLTGSNNLCIGQTTTISPSTGGGTWSSSNTAIATINSSGVVLGVSAGIVTLYYNTTSGACQNEASHAITVNSKPSATITGANIICGQSTTQLSPSTGGTWASSNTAVATVNNAGLVTGIASGTATFTFTNTQGCVSDPTATVTINSKPMISYVGPSTICINSNSQLNPSSGGTWTSSNTSVATINNSGTILGIAAGTATFTFTSSNGCVSDASSTLTVTTKPNLTIDYNGSICLTNDSKLTALVSGGTTPYTYNWTGPSSFTGNTQQINITANGNYSVTVSDINGCSVNASGFVYEKFDPFVVSLQTRVCEGTSVALNATTSSAVSYLWSSNAGNATTSAVNVIPIVPASTYTVTITNTLGCSASVSASITVDPKPIVNITGGATICQGATTTLSPTTGGTWVSNNPSVASVTNSGVVTALATGTATFIFTNSTTNCASDNSPIVTVSDKPVISFNGPTDICINGSTNLLPSSGGTWTSNNTSIATINNSGVVTGIASGTVTFTYLSSSSNCVAVTSGPLTVLNRPTVTITGDDFICTGLTTTLSPSSGGTWVSNNPSIASVTNSGVVTGLAAGTATFTFTNFSGCVSNATNPITINGKPSISFTGPTSGCIGSMSSMNPSSNGIWTSSNPSVATINNAGIITAVSSGTATFTYTSGITSCISDASSPYTVIERPVVSIVGTSSLCIGSNTLLNPSTGGTWTSNNPAVATVTNGGVVTAVTEGTATFYFTNSSTGCVSNNTNPVLVYAKPVVSITGANTICIGSTSTLSPSSGGAWSSSNTGIATVNSNGIVLGVSQGSATFTFTETSSGCTSNPSLPITVGPRPTVSITGPTTLCIGGASALSPNTGGSWVSNNPSIATVDNAGVVTAISQGSVTFTFTSNSGCSSNPTSSILINGKPTILFTGPNQICIGGTTTISPASGGSWISNHPSIATINNSGVITGISNGQATFTYTDQSTGCLSDASVSLTVNELPVINNLGSNQICVGTTTQLAPTTGGIWMSNNPSVADVSNNGTVTGITEGSAGFVYTNSVTGCSSNQVLTITVNPKPVINISGSSSICVGSTTTMNPSTGGTWISKNPTIASINNSGVVTGLAQGIARFTFTNSTTGCISNNSAPILVNGHPSTSITGPNQICLGSTSQLSPSVGGTWVSEQPTVATVTNTGLITGITAGTASFIFTETASGCSSPQGQNLITVTSSAPPTIVGASTICLKYQTQLAAPVNGVVWSSSNNKIATISNDGVVTGHAPGKVSFSYMIVATGCVGSLPADAITVVNCIDPDFNVGISNLTIIGNVSTNDEVPMGTNWGQAMLISKPQGSTATITVNSDGTYAFVGNTKGQYIYNIPVCVPPMIYGCPSSQLIITVLDPLDTGNKNIANLDLATVYTGDSIWMNAMANDKCLNSTNCTLEGSTMEQTNTNLNGSSYLGLTGGFVYKPNNNAMGLDTIIYKICVDGDLTNCNQSRQYVVINAPNAINSTVAADDFLSTYAETSVTGDLTANDSDPEDDAQTIVAQGSATARISIPEGKYYIENTGVLHFEPVGGFVGTVDIIYTICDDNASNQKCVKATAHVLVMGDMSLAIRIYLEGALMSNNGQTTPEGRPLMRDELRNNTFDGKNYIPVKDPYKFGTEFVIINNNYEYVATGTMAKYDDPLDSLAVFSVTGRDAIVDWVFVELRSKSNNKTIVASRSGLLQRDGDIVDIDGVSTLKFAQVSLDSFYVVVRHRNHLGVMSSLVANGQLVDFTLPSTQVFDFGTTLNNGMNYTGLALNPSVKNGYMALWAGDFDANRKLKFTNPSDDQNTLFFDVFAHEDNISGNANYNNAIGYYQGDYNMNGKSKYDNPNDDKNLLFSQILLYPLNTQYLSNFDFFIEQIPK